MKRIKFFAICILTYSTILVSCKTVLNQSKTSNVAVETETVISKSNIKNRIINDSVNKLLSKLSLDELLKEHQMPTNKRIIGITKERIEGEIVRRHEIDSDIYAKFRDDFWKRKTSYIHPIDYAKLKAILDSASSTDYILFTFTEDKVATDFNYQIVKNHTFNSFVSCFPAVLLKQMIYDKDYERITVGKGVKYISNPPYSLPANNFSIAMLKYFDNKGNVQYFDIVEDPSITPKQ